jgi:hypothetical protein
MSVFVSIDEKGSPVRTTNKIKANSIVNATPIKNKNGNAPFTKRLQTTGKKN